MSIQVSLKTWCVLGAVACTLPMSPASATHSWGTYHWARASNPFTLKLGDNVSTAWDVYLGTAASVGNVPTTGWSFSNVLHLMIVPGNVSPKTCRATTGMVQVCNSQYGNNGWLGVAGIYISGGHITAGYVKLNDTYYSSATYNTPAWRNLVMCQEIGHTLGLGHVDENFSNPNLGTCMDYTKSPETNQYPNEHDYEMLGSIYTHLDTTTTVAASSSTTAPAAMYQISFDGPGQWGKLVARSVDGGQEVYELDFGGGHKIVTHVTWTIEVAERRRQRSH